MNSLISRSTEVVVVAIASLDAATPARAQSDERAIVAAIDGMIERTGKGTGPGNDIAATSRTEGCRAIEIRHEEI